VIIVPDTNVWIKLLNPGETPVKDRFRVARPEEIRLCCVVKAELYFGAYRSSRKKDNLALLESLFKVYASLPFDDRAAKIYGKIRAKLADSGSPIGPNDLLIAAVALANKAVLITHNIGEFQRVRGLKIEDWEQTHPT
jgi:tRNA(fMet)-specific endonuclease VapC